MVSLTVELQSGRVRHPSLKCVRGADKDGGDAPMKMSNDTYCVTFKGTRTTERYYRDRHGWLKVSSRGRVFRMSAEQVLNHLLPALAFGERRSLTVAVEHTEIPYWQTPAAQADPPSPPRVGRG